MRIFVGGKGGAGKTTVVAALASALAEEGVRVTAVDADGSPNLAISLGAGDPEDLPAVANDTAPPDDDTCDAEPVTAEGLAEDFAVRGGSGVDVVQTGRIERPSDRCLCCGSHATAREVVAALPGGEDEVVLVDLEPGLNDLLWARPQHGDMLFAVTDASVKAVEVTRRLLQVADQLGVSDRLVVANKLREGEGERVREALPEVSVLEIAYDPRLDGAVPDGDGLPAVRALVDGADLTDSSDTGAAAGSATAVH